MAPTLLGDHLRASCDECGYAFTTDEGGAVGRDVVAMDCPMCFNPLQVVPPHPGQGLRGDRILVQKYLYRFAEPRRYDVAVFKNPEDPETNFIKRLVGLPNETLMLLDGNVYVQAEHHGPWRIARKTDPAVNPRWERIQRDVFQPVYHSRYVPADRGQGPQRRRAAWHQPWEPVGSNAADTSDNESSETSNTPWQITTDEKRGAVFTFTPNTDTAAPSATLRFNPDPAESYRVGYDKNNARYAYNQPDGSGQTHGWFEDLRLAATVTPDATNITTDTSVTLTAAARWNAGPETFTARFDADGTVSLTPEIGDPGRVLPPVSLPPFFHPGQPTTLELWIVDQSFLLWIDGRLVFRHDLDLSRDQLFQRPPPITAKDQRPTVTVTGGAATLHHLELDRDLVYNDRDDTGVADRGSVNRNLLGKVDLRHASPVELDTDHFFAVGDNSPQSQDSRKWGNVNTYVANHYFANYDTPDIYGRVPRDLLMGRAFFVYFPAPTPLVTGGKRIVPNFAEMRFIH